MAWRILPCNLDCYLQFLTFLPTCSVWIKWSSVYDLLFILFAKQKHVNPGSLLAWSLFCYSAVLDHRWLRSYAVYILLNVTSSYTKYCQLIMQQYLHNPGASNMYTYRLGWWEIQWALTLDATANFDMRFCVIYLVSFIFDYDWC